MEINTIRGRIGRRAVLTAYAARTHSNDITMRSGDTAAHSEDITTRSGNTVAHSEDITTRSGNTAAHSEDITMRSGDTVAHSNDIAAPQSGAAVNDTFSVRETGKSDAAVMLYTPSGTLSNISAGNRSVLDTLLGNHSLSDTLSDISAGNHSVSDTLSDISTENHSAVQTIADRKAQRYAEQLEKIIQQKKAADLAAQEYKIRMEEAKRYTELLAEEAKNRRIALEIYRRIAHGGRVPPQDERWLMEYSPQLYFSAKMQALQAEENKKYDSALEDEEDSDETAGESAEISAAGTDNSVSAGENISPVESVSAVE